MAKKLPAYQALALILREKIEAGDFPQNCLLPTEHELAAQYNLSRHTIRLALRQLREIGLISSQQGTGSIVIAIKATPTFQHSAGSFLELQSLFDSAKREVVEVNKPRRYAFLAKAYAVSADQLWIHVRLLWIKDRLPLMISDLYIDQRYAELVNTMDLETHIVKHLCKNGGVKMVKVQQDITATLLTLEQATLLKARVDTPALVAARHYYTASSLPVISISTSPAKRYSFSSVMSISNQVL